MCNTSSLASLQHWRPCVHTAQYYKPAQSTLFFLLFLLQLVLADEQGLDSENTEVRSLLAPTPCCYLYGTQTCRMTALTWLSGAPS